MRTEALKAVGYVSRASTPVDSNELAILEDEARTNNGRADITGLLVFDSGCFVQVLEGPADAVDATLARIRRDTRHEDLELVLDTPISARSFGRWALASVDLRAPAASVDIGDLAGDLAHFLARIDRSQPRTGLMLLSAFQQLLSLLGRMRGEDRVEPDPSVTVNSFPPPADPH
ncbi:MAG: BLUF domain-containing protein [Pseudomonadales bacterium]|nr:BLUF domain-containing protein [Pseudomonadales bacterium]